MHLPLVPRFTTLFSATMIGFLLLATPAHAQSSPLAGLSNLFQAGGLGKLTSCLPFGGGGGGAVTQTNYVYSKGGIPFRTGSALPQTSNVLGQPTGPRLLAVYTTAYTTGSAPFGSVVGYASQGVAPFSPQYSAQQLAARSQQQAMMPAGIEPHSSGQSFLQSLFQPFRQFSSCLSNATHPQADQGQDEDGGAPAVPTLTSGGACLVGSPHSINFVSTDPEGDNVRYGVDWDADGSVNEWVPPSGYVASGASQNASRTYSMAGQKTVKVIAQDESGLSSDWATLSFSCAETPPPAGDTTAGINENGNTNQNNNTNTGGTPAAALDLRVIPSLVKSGNTTKVNWSATGVSSCTVAGQNGDTWSTLQSAIGGNISKPITGQTTYTLSCLDAAGATLTKSATVKILPTFQEL